MAQHERTLILALYFLSLEARFDNMFNAQIIGELHEKGWYDKFKNHITPEGQEVLDKLYADATANKKNPREARRKFTRAAQSRISKKIAKLRREGYGAKQAAAIAYKYEREHLLGPRGGKKKNPASICVAHSKKLLSNLKKDHPDVKYRILSSDLVKHKGKWVCKTEMLEDCKTFTYFHDSI